MPGTPREPDAPNFDRRLVPRQAEFRLEVTVDFERSRRWPQRSSRRSIRADVLDLSLDGALLRTSADVRFVVGQQIAVELAGGRAAAEVRRQVPRPDATVWRYYGVRFGSQDSAFRKTLLEHLAEDRQDLLAFWERSR